jgi:hypothetical protein
MLGDYQSALDEIVAVDSRYQDHRDVLHITCRAHWGLRNIPLALAAVNRFIEVAPEHPFGYTFKAMLLSCDGRHRESYDLLMSVISQFTGHATMHYDLAHAAAQCELWPEARQWLYLAICAQPELKQIALDSPVFAQIASEIETMCPLQ